MNKQDSHTITPKLRFPEFQTTLWKEQSLSTIGDSYNGLSGKTKEDFGKGKLYIQYKQVFANSKIDVSNCGLVNIAQQ
ncbi:hypothetical protein EV693_11053 [Nicoletella semolina]|uniref:Uncharacterized protein n=1 Tax=Nicoletella semolina TaxID=271160 RepID=A0A4R2N6Y4_9PAST|nr:hypothetical protein [Nicoletella semolina]MDH2924703.1 hypothetical protein [Nicoletella semolina]TCP16673.1 hypothetical protein EV693_11053 [Nicoletella semolina]